MLFASYNRYWEPSYVQTMQISTVAGTASALLSQPFEFMKTRIQTINEGIGVRGVRMNMGYNMYKVFTSLHEAGYGSRVLYTGLGDALASRLSFLLVRNSVYKFIYDRRKPRKMTNDLTYREKGVIAGVAGGLGALASNFFETRMVRQIGDVGRSSKFVRSDLSHNAFNSGLSANILRTVLLNGLLTWCYDQMKIRMRSTFGESFIDAPVALLVTSLLATAVILPVDNIKTRLQYQFTDPSLTRLNYGNNACNAVSKAIYHEGFYTFYAGAYPFFAKLFIYSLSTVYISDIMEKRYKRLNRNK